MFVPCGIANRDALCLALAVLADVVILPISLCNTYFILFRIYWEPYTRLLKPSLAFQASTDPVDTSAQAALAPRQTTEQKESADTT
jgi:hypothetical protein